MTDIFDNVVRDLAGEIEAAVNGVRIANQFTEKCESPIELAFAAVFSISATLAGLDVRWGPVDSKIGPPQYLMIQPQAVIGEYRVDFLCSVVDVRGVIMSECIVVECDGHEWHEKTKEQAARDKARDRVLQMSVGKVVHFTGSELFRSPGACAHEVLELIGRIYNS